MTTSEFISLLRSQFLTKAPLKLQRQLIAQSVDYVIRASFPESYIALCHVYAIVGANVLSTIYEREYIPMAGVGVVRVGKNNLKMLDNEAFGRESGGSYHCWIESRSLDKIELVDFTFRHNQAYARLCGLYVKGINRKLFLWDLKYSCCLDANDDSQLPNPLPKGKVWFQETHEGAAWLQEHIYNNKQWYVIMTSFALKYLKLELNRYLDK